MPALRPSIYATAACLILLALLAACALALGAYRLTGLIGLLPSGEVWAVTHLREAD